VEQCGELAAGKRRQGRLKLRITMKGQKVLNEIEETYRNE